MKKPVPKLLIISPVFLLLRPIATVAAFTFPNTSVSINNSVLLHQIIIVYDEQKGLSKSSTSEQEK
jgi:hypothetical protein